MPDLFGTFPGFADPLTVTVMLAAMVVAGFMRGFVGFGASMIMVLVLSHVISPAAAVAVASLSGVPVMVQLLPAAVRRSERSFVLPFACSSFVAAPLGTWVLVTVDGEVMKIAIATAVLVMVALMYRGWHLSRSPGPGVLVGMGAFSGVIQGGGGVVGPPAVVVALARAGDAERQRANVIGVVAALNLCAIPPLAWHGLYTREVVLISLVLVPVYLAASWFGIRFFASGGHRYYRDAALALLSLTGLATLVRAIHDVAT